MSISVLYLLSLLLLCAVIAICLLVSINKKLVDRDTNAPYDPKLAEKSDLTDLHVDVAELGLMLDGKIKDLEYALRSDLKGWRQHNALQGDQIIRLATSAVANTEHSRTVLDRILDRFGFLKPKRHEERPKGASDPEDDEE
jgi:hypothetical protein